MQIEDFQALNYHFLMNQILFSSLARGRVARLRVWILVSLLRDLKNERVSEGIPPNLPPVWKLVINNNNLRALKGA